MLVWQLPSYQGEKKKEEKEAMRARAHADTVLSYTGLRNGTEVKFV